MGEKEALPRSKINGESPLFSEAAPATLNALPTEQIKAPLNALSVGIFRGNSATASNDADGIQEGETQLCISVDVSSLVPFMSLRSGP